MESQKNYPMTLRVPFSILEFIDETIEKKLQDGENKSTANRTAVSLEMLKIGARVLKKKNEQGSDQDITFDEKLALIADAVLKSKLQIESMFELSFKNPKEIDSNTINQFGYEAVNNKIKEVDYKISHFFKQK
ncbi:hypothetical protein [Arsenophonus nasoniae]|uniref:Relaxosome protein TraM n=1 Tax=Arsenophonus nasoniae TaxID=638 RepID=A0AA95KEM8_9GAMM|nr:hypothetical protein [Arsenophonus nasoniae]WGM03263.1 hypothetical protein QE210_17805 [Arsenophonus nasoniae]WGM03409.1 hypothetical protein QE210_18640 [Arsenophonus nasoniae]